MIVETVEIRIDSGKAIINKSDFDEKKHTLYSEKVEKPKPVIRSKRKREE